MLHACVFANTTTHKLSAEHIPYAHNEIFKGRNLARLHTRLNPKGRFALPKDTYASTYADITETQLPRDSPILPTSSDFYIAIHHAPITLNDTI